MLNSKQRRSFYYFVFVSIFALVKIAHSTLEVIEDPRNNSTTVIEEVEEVATNETVLQSTDPRNVSFYLYPNPQNMTEADEILLGDSESLAKSGYNKSNPVFFIIHGFLNNYTTRYSQNLKNAFLNYGFGQTTNLIVVDWGKLATPENQTLWLIAHLTDPTKDIYYNAAVKNVPLVGYRVAEFVSFLMYDQYLLDPTDVYLLGFSLGAQVSGYAGMYLKKNGSALVGRITGFDPASPLYQHAGIDERLDVTDAKFVDIVHSNQGQDGFLGNIGSLDFYPNGGGPNQPDCLDSIGVEVITNTITGSCAHNRAWIYYIQAFSEKTVACKCFSYADFICRFFCTTKSTFGYYCDLSAPSGSYYFDMIAKEPAKPNANATSRD